MVETPLAIFERRAGSSHSAKSAAGQRQKGRENVAEASCRGLVLDRPQGAATVRPRRRADLARQVACDAVYLNQDGWRLVSQCYQA